MSFLLLLAICHSGHFAKPEIQCDAIEINHLHRNGKEAFVQVIVWNWSADYHRLDCHGYTLINDVVQLPGGRIKITTQAGKVLYARGPVFTSFTDFDPERENQKLFPPKHRHKVLP